MIQDHNKPKKKKGGGHHCGDLWGLQIIPQISVLTEKAQGHKPYRFNILILDISKILIQIIVNNFYIRTYKYVLRTL
jgi:hypothetical protein